MSKNSEDIDVAYARNSDPMESLQAAGRVNARKQMRHLLAVMLKMRRTNFLPASDGDIADYAHRNHYRDSSQGLRSRRHEAVKAGWVEKTDRDGVTSMQRRCARWDLTEDGVNMARRIVEDGKK